MPLTSVLPSELVDGVFECAIDPMLILSSDTQSVLAMNAAARALVGQHTRTEELLYEHDGGGLPFDDERGELEIALRTRAGAGRFCAVYVGLRAENSKFWMLTLRPLVTATADAQAHAERLEMIGELAGGLARNFKNVLQAISLSDEPSDRAEGRGSTDIVARGVTEALTVGAELLATWNALAATEVIGGRRRRVDYSDVVRRCERLVRQLTRSIEEVIFEYPVEPVEIDADEGQLIQLILTMCFRAREAVARNMGSSLQVRLTVVGDSTRLIVRDDGQPLSVEALQVLRGVGEPRGLSPGSLRTLTTLSRLVDGHGGQLSVTSPVVEDRGAEFVVDLRRASDAYPRDFGRVPTTTTARRRDSIWTHVHERT